MGAFEWTREAARDTFEANCTTCHDTDLVKSRTAGWDRQKIRKALDRLEKLRGGMPPRSATPQQKGALAGFLDASREGGVR